MVEKMRAAAEIVAEVKSLFAAGLEGTAGHECFQCRLIFEIYKEFPDVRHGASMNVATGELIPTGSIKALSSGYEMRQALGLDEGCLCNKRPVGRFDERFIVKDEEGKPVANVRYRIFANDTQIQTGVTDSDGLTERVVTAGLKFVTLELEI